MTGDEFLAAAWLNTSLPRCEQRMATKDLPTRVFTKLDIVLLTAEILHHLRCMKPCKLWAKLPINWCRISSNSKIYPHSGVFWSKNIQKRHRSKRNWSIRYQRMVRIPSIPRTFATQSRLTLLLGVSQMGATPKSRAFLRKHLKKRTFFCLHVKTWPTPLVFTIPPLTPPAQKAWLVSNFLGEPLNLSQNHRPPAKILWKTQTSPKSCFPLQEKALAKRKSIHSLIHEVYMKCRISWSVQQFGDFLLWRLWKKVFWPHENQHGAPEMDCLYIAAWFFFSRRRMFRSAIRFFDRV